MSKTAKAARPAEGSSIKLIRRIKAGLPAQELDVLARRMEMSGEALASKLGVSRATFHRRKSSGRLEPEESDRLMRFARLLDRAVETFESEESALRWLKSPQFGLGGEIPLKFAETEVGAREVEDLLGRIEYNVYS